MADYHSTHTGAQIDAAVDAVANKQDKLPTVVNDKYLHANSSTGALEWADAGSAAPVTTSILKGNGSGGISAASIADGDYFGTLDNSSVSDANDFTSLGAVTTWNYFANNPFGQVSGVLYGILYNIRGKYNSYVEQHFCSLNQDSLGCHAIRIKYDSSLWQPWEWVNPPMQVGVEYRTTERYQGNPVYIMTQNCGAPPSGASKTVSLVPSDVDKTWFIQGQITYWGIPIPSYNSNGTYRFLANVSSGTRTIEIFASENRSSDGYVFVTYKYVKTAD